MIEKVESCPKCNEVMKWLYDAQICAACGHGNKYAKGDRAIELADQIDRLMLGLMEPVQPAWIDSAIELLRESAAELRKR